MSRIPAICLNQDCSFVFKPRMINIGNGVSVIVEGCHCNCPKCGSLAKIVDGQYVVLGEKLFATIKNISDIKILKKSLQTLEEALVSSKSPEEIKEKVKTESPKFSLIWDLIPQTRKDAYMAIGLILALLKLCSSCFSDLKSATPNTVINVQQTIIVQGLQTIYSQNNLLLSDNQQDTHNGTLNKQEK